MRVTFVIPTFSTKPIGGVRVVYQYADGLVGRGHDVTIVHAAFMEPWQYLDRLSTHREPRILARGLVDISRRRPSAVAWHDLDERVRLVYAPTLSATHVPDADVVVATSWRTAESVARYPSSKGRKHYLVQHYETWDGPAERVDATWRSPLRKIVIAKWLYERGLALGVAPEDLFRLPNPGVDPAIFRLTRPVAGRSPRVAMLWSPAPLKGGLDGVAAVEAARRDIPGLEAVLFGVSPRPASLPEWIEYVHNPSRDVLVDDVYNRSSIYLCPSWSEGWHLPPAEAMGCGCAVVSTDIDGVREYARHGETALLAGVRDSVGLAANIVRLCRDEEERNRLAKHGKELIGGWTVERSLDAFELYLKESEDAL
jgi:L-malate glycosyltransferase